MRKNTIGKIITKFRKYSKFWKILWKFRKIQMKTLRNGPYLILVEKSGKCRKNTENSKTRKNTSEKSRGKILVRPKKRSSLHFGWRIRNKYSRQIWNKIGKIHPKNSCHKTNENLHNLNETNWKITTYCEQL